MSFQRFLQITNSLAKRRKEKVNAIVIYGKESKQRVITNHRNDTGGEFTIEWISTIGRRGFYQAKSDNWVPILSDVALASSKDEKNLKIIFYWLKRKLKEAKISYTEIYLRGSDAFSTGVDIWIQKEDYDRFDKTIGPEYLKKQAKLRNLQDFISTALTGKDPKDQSEADKEFAKIAKEVRGDESIEELRELTKKAGIKIDE